MASSKKLPASFAIFLMLISITSIQVGSSLAKSLFHILGPKGVCAVRIAAATLILVIGWRVWRFRVSRVQLRAIGLYGVVLGMMNLTYYMALERLPLGLTVAIEFLGPLSVAIWFSRKPLDFLWALLAILGIVLVLPITADAEQISLIGVILALVAGACWAAYIVFGSRAGGASHAGVATTIGMLFAFLTVLPFAAFDVDVQVLFDWKVLLAGAGVGVLSSAFPYSLEMLAMKSIPKKNFGILLSLSPAVAALAGWVVLKEELTAVQWAAITCIFIASFGSAVSITPKRDQPVPVEV